MLDTETVQKVDQLPSLELLAPLVRDRQPPTEDFDPGGDWRQTWALYSLTGVSHPVGTLRIDRRRSDGEILFDVRLDKPMMPAVYQVEITARIRCRDDDLASLRTWEWQQCTKDSHGKVKSGTLLKGDGRLRNGAVLWTSGGRARAIKAASPCTLNWTLFDVAQRLVFSPQRRIDFTLIDHFDRVIPGHYLAADREARVQLGGERVMRTRTINLEVGTVERPYWDRKNAQQVTLHGWRQSGPAQIPWHYWVDSNGRLLFAASGIEGYALQQSEMS